MICVELDWTVVRKILFSVEPQVQKGYDQDTLSKKAWPTIRQSVAVYDSFYCNKVQSGSLYTPGLRFTDSDHDVADASSAIP